MMFRKQKSTSKAIGLPFRILIDRVTVFSLSCKRDLSVHHVVGEFMARCKSRASIIRPSSFINVPSQINCVLVSDYTTFIIPKFVTVSDV